MTASDHGPAGQVPRGDHGGEGDHVGGDVRAEIARGERFAFGRNWRRFLDALGPDQVDRATASLERVLGPGTLAGRSFLDIGSGSGLSSLAARNLGAVVHSLDVDPDSVACTRALRDRYRPDDPDWTVEQASALDREHLRSLGRFDVVYSWGVLHHTGDQWRALDLAVQRVGPGGRLWVALYNDQGRASVRWAQVKRTYQRSGPLGRRAVLVAATLRLWGPTMVRDLLRGHPMATWRQESERGMDPRVDVLDWVGGWPFEVSTPEQVVDAVHRKGLQLRWLRTTAGGLGCNEYLFERPLEG